MAVQTSHVENVVVRFPLERRLTQYRERVFDENGRYPVSAEMSDAELDALAERIFSNDCAGCVETSVYAKIRVGLGKARDRSRARRAGAQVLDFDLCDDELVELEAVLYVCRRDSAVGGGG